MGLFHPAFLEADPMSWLYATYHLLWEPETTIDTIFKHPQI